MTHTAQTRSAALLALVLSLGVGFGASAQDAPTELDTTPVSTEAHDPSEDWLKDVPMPKPVKPVSNATLDRAIGRGVTLLLQKQNKNGSWGGPYQTKGLNIYAPVPGAHHAFRVAVTALCVSALIETYVGTGDSNDPVLRAIERGEAFLLQELPKVRRAVPDAIYNVWAHGYGVGALVRMRERLPDDAQRIIAIDKVIHQQYDMLERYESVDGGWGYYDFRVGTKKPAASSSSFTSAAVLVALKLADRSGVAPPTNLVQRALDSIRRQQKPDLTYLYGEYFRTAPMRSINRPGGSLGRSQACNVALRMWGDPKISDKAIKAWLNRLYARNGWLSIGRKRPIPHEAWFAVAGYFYYFGHYYAAHCIDQLPAKDRPYFQDHLAHIILPLQEKDGSWWDYPFYDYHQQYGTAMALMTLQRCRKAE